MNAEKQNLKNDSKVNFVTKDLARFSNLFDCIGVWRII